MSFEQERDKRLPNTSPPFYWRRVYQGATELDEVDTFVTDDEGTLHVTMGVPRALLEPEFAATAVTTGDIARPGLVIYGRAVWPKDKHDLMYTARMKGQGLIFSLCYSTQCVDGEVGCHPLATLTEITREEFEHAQERGWT